MRIFLLILLISCFKAKSGAPFILSASVAARFLLMVLVKQLLLKTWNPHLHVLFIVFQFLDEKEGGTLLKFHPHCYLIYMCLLF